MPDKYRNKYRVSSARLPNWDYGCNAAYFVTICMQNHHHYFGNIVITVETPELGVSKTKPTNTIAPASEKWKPGTLGVIVNQYKRAVTINARKINPDFAWQSRFHDHIIRNDESFERICNYILLNPENWENDKFNISTQLT